MDKRTAEKLTERVKEIIEEVKQLEREEKQIQKEKESYDINKEARHIRHYLFEVFDYQVDDIGSLAIIDQAIKDRLENKLAKKGFLKKLDKPMKKGGAGLDKRTARKMARRMELLVLGKYK